MRHLIVVLTLALVAVGLLAGPATAVGTISDTENVRLPGGSNLPAQIALRFSRATFGEGEQVDEVLLATEGAFADALASGTLQGDDTPLLLTGTTALRADVASEIDRLGARRVTILGGTAAIAQSVEDRLTDIGLDVTRLAGTNRFETAVAIADEVPDATTAIVARGFAAGGDDTQAFADALAAGAWAAENGWPIYLTNSEELTPSTRDALANSDIEQVMLLGGEAAITPQVQTDLEALGLDVERVAGANRFDTATAIAAARGFDDADDTSRVILVEGQADDAWAGGFSAAAHGAAIPAPVVLANGETLPPATQAFLSTASFAVDATDVTLPVLICAASAAACDEARALLGLPQEADLTLDEPTGGVPSRSQLSGTLDLHGTAASVAVFGACITDGLIVPGDDGAFAIEVSGQPGVCQLMFEVRFGNGSVQLIQRPVLVTAALPLDGVVVNTDTGGNVYTLTPDGADRVVIVAYQPDDEFVVDGQPATIGAFEATITVADRVVFSADTPRGTVHDLRNVDPATITAGTVGNVNLQAGTFAIIEPVSGVTLRGGLELTDERSYAIGNQGRTRQQFEADINEGDAITVATSSFSLTNRDVTGLANTITIDAVSGIARLRIGSLGDDPLTAEDERFRARADAANQSFRVDTRSVEFAAFAEALSDGDQMTYRRLGGIEQFTLVNAAPPSVSGLVTETFNPDGSPVAPQPVDGGSLTVLTPTQGRQALTYTPDAIFRIDGRIATEAEFEVARTPGDEVAYQAGDDPTDTVEELSLVNRDLTGDLARITPGETTFDVVVLAGVVYRDLDYTGSIFGGASTYVVNGSTVGLAVFENELTLVIRGEVLATILVRPTTDGGTEHRLTSVDVSG
ncbi:hypothetical protein BH23ACT9_BH23ACT9_37840 [soil metagenome]